MKSDTLNFLEWEKKNENLELSASDFNQNAFKTTQSAHSAMVETDLCLSSVAWWAGAWWAATVALKAAAWY